VAEAAAEAVAADTTVGGMACAGKKVYIVDARPSMNATANKANGAGYENMAHYGNGELIFMDIENIHVVRNSYNKMRELCLPGETPESEWLSSLDGTGWLGHIIKLIHAAARIAQYICQGHYVLVHCSDGWDRTAQLTALPMLLLDPYYRTLRGFEVLIEKEWVSFGHKFHDRCGACVDENEHSPIFIQFVDCVWQITQQFPSAFEFNEELLLALVEHTTSCRFGTFLFNCERERSKANVRETTTSLWAYVNEHEAQFRNALFTGYDGGISLETKMLFPCFSPKKVKVWEGYFFRWDKRLRPLRAVDDIVVRYRELMDENARLQRQVQALSGGKPLAHTP